MVHLQQNAQAYVPRHELKGEVAAAIQAIFNAPHLNEAKRLLAETVQQYRTSAPKLATWMEENLPEGLLVFAFTPRVPGGASPPHPDDERVGTAQPGDPASDAGGAAVSQ